MKKGHSPTRAPTPGPVCGSNVVRLGSEADPSNAHRDVRLVPQMDKWHFMSWVSPIWVRGLFLILENLSRLRIHSDFMQAIGALDVEGGSPWRR